MVFAAGCVSPASSTDDEVAVVLNGLSTPYQFSNRPAKTHTLAERMELYQVPGVSIAYFRDGEILWARGIGVLEIGETTPITPNTIFQAASITKPVTAMTVLSLVEDGVLTLDEPIDQWLGEWEIPDNPFTDRATPTLRQLLSHSAGVSQYVTAGYERDEDLPTVLQMLTGTPPAKTVPVTFDYAPGSKYVYSVGTYLILQHIIENVTNQSFSEAACERVLEPNGMTHSAFYPNGLPSGFADDGYARAHTGEGSIFDGDYKVYPELAAAGLWTTPSDLAKFAIDVQKSLRGASNNVLSAEMTQQMLTRQIGIWGLGWEFMTREGTPPSFYHSGSNLGYKSIVYARMDGSEGVAIMVNGENGGDIFFEILAGMSLIYDWEELKPEEREIFDMTPQDIAVFEGQYAFSEPIEGVVIVKAFDELITLEIPGFFAAREFYPGSPTSFFDLGGNSLRFELDEAGTPTKINFGDVVGTRQ